MASNSAVLQEFLIRFGFRMDQMSANATLQSMEGIGGKLNVVARTAVTTFRILSNEVYRTTMEMATLQNSADRIGMSVGSLDNILMATRAAGGQEADALKTLQSLQLKVGEGALRLGMGATTFRKFGINIFETNKQLKSMDKLLGEIAVRFRTPDGSKLVDPRVRNALARQFGISEDFARVLAGDFGEMIAITHKMGEAFEYNMDKMGAGAQKFRKEVGKLSMLFRIIRRSASGQNASWFANRLFRLNKAIVDQAKGISYYTNTYAGFSKTFFSFVDAAGVTIFRLLGYLGRLLNLLGPIGKLLGGLVASAGALYLVLLPFAHFFGMAMLPLLGYVGAALFGIYMGFLLLDDVLSWFHGDESYFEPIYDSLYDIFALLPRLIFRFDDFKKRFQDEGILKALFPTYIGNKQEEFTKFWEADSFKEAIAKAQEITKSWMDMTGMTARIGGNLETAPDMNDPSNYSSEGNIVADLYRWVMKYFTKKSDKDPNEISSWGKYWVIFQAMIDSSKKAVKEDKTETWLEKVVKAVEDGFHKLIEAVSFRKFMEALKEIFIWGDKGGNIRTGGNLKALTADEIAAEGERQHGIIGEMLNNKRKGDNGDKAAKDKAAIDAKYGAPPSGELYSKWYETWYKDREGKSRQFGKALGSDKAIAEDKYFADMADADAEWAKYHTLNPDEIPQAVTEKGMDVYAPATSGDGEEEVTITPGQKTSMVPSIDTPSYLSLNPSMMRAAGNSNQNVVVNTTVNVSGAGNPQDVANKVIDQQYTVATNTAGIIRPYLNEAAYG